MSTRDKKLFPKGKSTRNTIPYLKCVYFMRICSLRAVPFLLVCLEYAGLYCINLIMTQFICCVFAYKNSYIISIWAFFTIFCLPQSFAFLLSLLLQNMARIVWCTKHYQIQSPHVFLLLFKNDDFALDNAKKVEKIGITVYM